MTASPETTPDVGQPAVSVPEAPGITAADVDALWEELAATAAAWGRDDVVTLLRAARSTESREQVQVMVVGEKKRGKSSLINALIGREGLLPVDVDIATSAYIALGHSPTEYALVYTDDSDAPAPIPVSELAEWASVEGNSDPHDPDVLLHLGVRGVEVGIDAPLLAEGITLIDTPGVGGLEAGHTELTLAALSRADALVFVLDPTSPITGSELSFLKRATERIARVVFVLTKTDAYPGWEQVMADDRALVARHASRFADASWLAVASPLAGDARRLREAGDPARAEEAWNQSGVAALSRALGSQLARRGSLLRLANQVEVLNHAQVELTWAERSKQLAASGDPKLADELDARRDALQALLEQRAGWQREFQTAFTKLDAMLSRGFRRRVQDAHTDIEGRIATLATLDDGFVGEVDAMLRAVWADVEDQRRREVATLTAQLARQLADDGFPDLVGELPYPERLAELPPLRERRPDEQQMIEYLPVASGGMAVHFLGGAVLPVLAGPIGIALGLAAGLKLNQIRRRRAQEAMGRADATRFVSKVVSSALDEGTSSLRDALAEDRERVVSYVTELLDRRLADCERQIVAARAAMAADEAEKAAIRAEAEHRLRTLGAYGERGKRLRRGVVAALADEP